MAEKQRTISGGESESDAAGNDLINSDINSIMNSSQISNASNDSTTSFTRNNFNITHNISGKSLCRFPKLEECAHFHYERVQLGKISVRLFDEKLESGNLGSNISQISDTVSQTKSYLGNNGWFIMRVIAGRSEPFLIRRSVENLKMLDELLHQCVYDRKISGLEDLRSLDLNDSQLETTVTKYLNRFSMIASDAMTCGPVLTWLQLDNKGRRLPVADTDTMRTINTPAVGAAYGVRRYIAQACDEISIEVGDMISVIDMPSPAESVWWRGKKSHLQKSQYEVGFFPQSCVATIGDKVPRNMPLPPPLVGSLAVSPTKPVLRKHGKLIAFFRSFILSRPSRRRLKQSGIYKERVFSCDLSEHLLNSGQDIPMVLKCCAEFIEEYGIVDGIYRLSGITSNIQKLRRAFDEERIPDLSHPDIKQDIHAVSSLLKMYFRELPNPLCTYQLYDNFVDAIQTRDEGEEVRLKLMKETVQKLPPPHYRTLKYLSTHLNKISRYSDNTGMTDRNLAIVWAPNLLRSPALESGGVAALRGVGVQAVVTEYLITHCESIFNSDDDFTRFPDVQLDSLTDSDSFVDQREHEHSLLGIERPKSLNVGGAKLLSIEEAQSRHIRSDNIDINRAIQINTSALQGGYIEVGGGPSSLPDKYHTVLPVPRSWQKRKTHSWKSLFSRAPRQSNSNHDMKGLNSTKPTNKISPCDNTNQKKLSQIHQSSSMISTDDKENKISNFATSNSQGKLSKTCQDIYDGKSITTMDVCVRSNSIDSLRTAGHSRSVSHDSYFDLLQSPLRAIGMDNSRELSELGLNFDREEPEMRIFSESESLVSSPKIGKDQLPPSSQQQRRIMRARPEEFSSTANSVNPSPKKQPRLNLQSPSDITNWLNHSNDESSCKRYKLEDQLSDIQFIDCNTPEHTICNNNQNNTNTIYASVQVHNPPTSSASSSHEILNKKSNSNTIIKNENKKVPTRNSYPGNRNHNHSEKQHKTDGGSREGRFSYPGISGCKIINDVKFFIEEKSDRNRVNNSNHHRIPITNRCSFYEPVTTSNNILPNETKNDIVVLRSSSAEIYNNIHKNSINRSKLSVATPQSPVNSPRYSLLVGETSSEASSSLNTPTYDTSRNSFDNNINNLTNTKDNNSLNKLKTNMSLDLNNFNNNINNKNKLLTLSTPNTPNHTTTTHTSDNTSQSMTPSEFGYHNLNRIQSNAVSLENSPVKSNIANDYENIESSFANPSLLKSTIQITYKSPIKSKIEEDDDYVYEDVNNDDTPVDESNKIENQSEKIILETNFDDKMVYEQVKFYKSTITEINDMLDNDNNKKPNDIKMYDDTESVVPNIINNKLSEIDMSITNDMSSSSFTDDLNLVNNKLIFNDDIAMSSDLDLDIQDSLEFDSNNLSLYENVHIKKPPQLYENINLNNKKIMNNKLISKTNSPALTVGSTLPPSNFLVKQLATKFETSPSDNLIKFDFNHKKCNKIINNNLININNNNLNNNNDNNSKTLKITRSLDENAFIREFGKKKLEGNNINHQSIQQINEYDNLLEISRRKSLEFTRPKSLNQPKTLPQIPSNNDNELCKNNLKLEFNVMNNRNDKLVKITPTTENRISLIQNNVINNFDENSDKNNLIQTKSGVLENCKLDRDRIEKIKEERRHQLNEKFRSESFRSNEKLTNYQCIKSKSKTELRECESSSSSTSSNSSSLRAKSKSRNDVSGSVDVTNTSPLIINTTNRIRRISDEKNQNDLCLNNENNDINLKLLNKKKLEKRDSVDYHNRERDLMQSGIEINQTAVSQPTKSSQKSQRDKMSPQRSIKDVAAMFESRMQNQ